MYNGEPGGFMSLTISNKGWVVIPAELRRKYGLKPGAQVQIVDYGGVLALVPALQDPIGQSLGLTAGKGTSLTESLLEEHRRELEIE
jgi:AbrB family looped-hinge helix DNA binding protein